MPLPSRSAQVWISLLFCPNLGFQGRSYELTTYLKYLKAIKRYYKKYYSEKASLPSESTSELHICWNSLSRHPSSAIRSWPMNAWLIGLTPAGLQIDPNSKSMITRSSQRCLILWYKRKGTLTLRISLTEMLNMCWSALMLIRQAFIVYSSCFLIFNRFCFAPYTDQYCGLSEMSFCDSWAWAVG